MHENGGVDGLGALMVAAADNCDREERVTRGESNISPVVGAITVDNTTIN